MTLHPDGSVTRPLLSLRRRLRAALRVLRDPEVALVVDQYPPQIDGVGNGRGFHIDTHLPVAEQKTIFMKETGSTVEQVEQMGELMFRQSPPARTPTV